ncbi:MAG: SDR family NAD(P)-dependent oxidoreductase [Actinomycetota bacterium]
MGLLDGRVAIITGGARGQGAAEGRRFAAEGATVYLTDVLAEDGVGAAAEIGGTFLPHDVTDVDQWKVVTERVLDESGRIDILVNNAGILRFLTMTETPVDVWDRIVAVNQTGVFLGMQAVAPTMKAQRSGNIINISSVAAYKGGSACFAYTATKWAVRGMTKGAAQELGPFGVRVNSVHPGIIDTPMMAGAPLEELGNGVPLKRYASADEVAKLVLWLASDESAYATGAEFVLDGGLTT